MTASRALLEQTLLDLGAGRAGVGVAVSGGVDSVTLAALAWSLRPRVEVRLFHATSPAVPRSARATLDAVAARRGWVVDVLDAGEVDDPAYADNPVDRCYFCKAHLFDAIAACFDGALCTGANVDDLDDHRPGRRAARERAVHEPFITAGFTKDDVRALARDLGLPEIAASPASPCLSSRVETGIRIAPPLLRLVDDVERALRPLSDRTVRCRIRRDHVVIEHEGIDEEVARALVAPLLSAARDVLAAHDVGADLSFAPYVRGSAFLRVVP